MMKFEVITVTGTRAGMSSRQRKTTNRLIYGWNPSLMHNGACEGADRQFFDMATAIATYIELWPSSPEQDRWARMQETAFPELVSIVYALQPPLVRNRAMVRKGKALIATPATLGEALRSGTWATIRYARKLNRPIVIIEPAGGVRYENWPGV